MRSLPLLVLLLLIAAPLLVHSGTIRHRREDKSTEDCAVSCSGSAGQYEKGKTYTFNWDTVTKIELGFDKAGTTVTHKAKAHVTYHKDCEFSLKLSAVFLDGAEVASDHAATLEKNVLRFGFEFGRVNSVCPSKDDPAWAVNIKRGFLSSFQTGFDDSEEIETDVSGDCHTEYSREGSSLTKKKNLAACQNAHHLHGVRNTHYSVHTKAQNVPLIKSNQDCKIELKDNRLFKSVCSEKHSVPQPFAEGTALESTVTQTVTFADAKDGASDLGAFGKRSNLRFDHSELEHDTRKNAHEGAKKNVEYLCPKAKSLLVKTESGARFVALINDLRQLSKADIDAAQSDCKAFRDAIALCGTEACMEVLVDVIKAAKPKEKAEIFQSVGLIQKPSFGTLNKLAGIADQASAQGLLGLSSLVHTYCVSDVDCDVVDGVKKIMGAIQKKVPAGCSVSVTGNTEALTAIKALGNAVVDVGSVELLNKCIENEKNPLVARVVAAEALHRKPCSAARNSVVEKVLFDEGEDVELRITAFRQLMECASEETLGKVVTQLKDERINQVGSYIWSYLNTKRSSSNPAFADLKAFLRRQTLPPKFNKDPRKFSRYTELGYHNQKANVGAHLDTSVVFVPENYIPRQLSANATIHLFGTSINIFEVESRLEGFDRPADQLFGPDGFFTNAGGFEFDKETYKHSSSKVAAMKDAFLKKIKFDEGRVAASLNLKIFGDDVYYNSYTNSKFVDEVVKNYTMEKGLQAMAELNSVDYEKNYLIVEAVHSVPTVSGFPLRFTLDAALAMKLKTSNKMDVTSLLKGKGEFETQLSSSPSGNLFVTASITLQTSKVRQGVRFESTVHTASSFIVKNSLKDGKFKSVVEMPEEKVELLHTKSDILKIINSVEKSVATGKGDEKTHCTGEAHPFVPVIMGFKGCVQLKKNLPMVEATVYIEKTDAKLKTYEVEIGGKKTADSLNVHMGFDTPGSKVSRKCGAKFDFSAADKKLNFNLELPMRKVNVDGKLDERKKLEDYGAKVNLTISDGNGKLLEEYDLSGDLKIENPEKETYSYSLNAKAVNNSKTAADLKTLVVYNLAKPYFKIDFNLAEALAKPIKLLSEFGVQNKKVTAKVDYAGLHSTSKLNVDGQFNGIQDLSGKLNGEYDFGKPGKVDLEVAHKFDHKNADHKLTQTLKASTTLLGDFEYQWSSEKKSDDVDASVTVNHGKSKNSLVVSSKKQPNGAFNIVATAKSDCLKLDHNLKAEYLLKVPVEFKLKVDFDGTHVKGVSGLLTHKLTTEPMIKLDGEMLLKYPGREISVKNNIAEQKKGRFNAKTVAQWAPKEKIELDSNIVFRPKDIEYSLETTATVNENAAEKIYIKKSYTKEKELRKVNLIAKIADKTIMEISGSVDGQFKQKQEITFAFKKDKLDQKAGAEVVNAFLEQKIDCTATATVEPSSDDLKISGQIKRDSKEFAKGSMALPSSYKNAKQLYKGDFTWDMDKTARTGVLEYKLEKNGDDHKHTMMVNADKTYKFDFDYERKKEDFTVKTKLEKGGKTISSADLKLAAPSWANFELDGKIVSDDPLPRRDINTRASLKLEDKKVDFEGRIDSNGERYMAKGDWTKDEHKNKEKQNEDYRHYKYKFDLEGGSQKINLNQQMKIKDVFTVTKVLTEFAAKVANYNYNVESDYESGKEDVRGKYKVTYNDKKYLTDFKYSYKDGRRQFTETSDYNGKKMTIELDSVYRDKEVAVNAEVKLPDNYGFGTSKFGCKKESYWNCNILGNINDKYTLGGSNAISDEHVKMDYKIRAAELVKNDGKLHVTMKKAESKYVVAAQMSHFERQYGLDVNVDQAKGEVKLKTPEKEYGSGSITVTKIKDGEYQLKTAMDGNSNMNVQCKIVDQDKDKQFDIKITDIEKPFQLKTMHKVANNEQKSAFELILEPDTTKSTYGIGIDLEDDQTKFRAFTLTAKHPKRQVQLKAERPEQTKYKLSLQPDLTGSRAPTVYEVDYDHNDKPDVKSVKFHGKVTDPALKNPIEVKFDANINVGSDHTSYTGESVFEFDYSGEADKKFRWSSKIDRSVAVKRFRRSVDQKHVFVWETKTEHKASGLHLRLFFHNDRVDHDGNLVPIKVYFGVGSMNLEKNIVEYSMEGKSNWENTASVRLNSPEGFMKGEFAKEGEKQYVVNFYHNDEKPSLKCEMSKTDEGLKMVVRDAKPNGDVKLHAIARVVNDRTAEIAVWHTENSQKVTDARFSVLLSKSQLIRANLFIRPEVNREIMKNSLITVKTVKDPTKNQFFRDTLLSIYKANREMNKDIVENMQTLTKGWIAEQRVFMKDFGAEYESLVDLAEENFEMAREIILVSYDTVYQKIEELVEAIPQTEFRDVLRSVKNSFNDVPQYINQVVEPFKKVAAKISEEIENGQKGLAEVFNYLDENMKLKELRSAINEFINKVVETDFIRVAITHARDFSKEYSLREVNTALGDVENNLGQYKSKIEKVWNEIKDQLIDYAAIFGVSSAVEAILEPAGNFEVERRITELVHFLRGKLTSKDLSEKIWNKWLPRITKKDLKKAEIEVEIPIPVRSNTLREVVDQVHPERLVAIKNDIVQKISAISLTPEQQNLGYAVLDTIHMYKPLSLNIYDVIPPFGSKAYLIGDSHFITFDGRVYEHNSACEMLLAADLVDSEFSVIGKFGKSGLESIKVEYKNRKIVLSRDGKITVNGNAETLPWQWLDDLSGVSRIKITQTDDHVHLHTYDGLHVQCQLNAQLCEVEVPGRMHGRSAGLLGSNDNEPNNDWDHVDGTKNKNDLKTMSSNNAVEGTCSPATPVKPAAEDEGCAAFFNTTDSPLRLCFAVVLPSPFYSMCAVERAKGRSCDVVSAYVAACHTVGVDIDLPQKCVKCDGIPENKDKDVEKMTGQDIVFVVEEAPCLTDYGKKISEFVSSLAKGSEKFGWVGFGGFGAHNHPHLQSSPSASVVFDAAGIQAVAKEDHYSVPEDSLLEMPAKSDPMRAVEFAINHYPFRLGAGKTVVLITCQKCAYNELGQHELLEQLLDLGVRLHHVTTEKVRGTEKMKAAGITAETVFDKAGADLGDRSTIRSPNDVCAVVAQETKGTVLNLKHGYTLASKLEKPTTDCQKCHCEVKGIHTKTVCHPCEVVEPVSVNSRTFSGIADFGSPAVEMDEDPDKRIRY